jgi:hypothetical protein
MKRLVVLAVGACFIFICLTDAHAWFGKKKSADDQNAPAAQQVSAQPPAQVEAPGRASAQPKAVAKEDKAKQEAATAKKQLEERKRKDLSNSEWTIELTPLNGKGKKEAETITFKDNQVNFVSYGKKGFPATNFTLSVQDDGMVIWETMQTSDKAGIAFWRGEMPDSQSMRGIFSYHPDAKTTLDYSFISTGKKGS